jgi:hypothetical protein
LELGGWRLEILVAWLLSEGGDASVRSQLPEQMGDRRKGEATGDSAV